MHISILIIILLSDTQSRLIRGSFTHSLLFACVTWRLMPKTIKNDNVDLQTVTKRIRAPRVKYLIIFIWRPIDPLFVWSPVTKN